MTSKKNRSNSIDIEFDIEFNVEFNVESKTRNRTRTSSGEKRRSNSISSRSMSIGSIESIILDDHDIDNIVDDIDDIDDKIDNIYNELLFKTNKTMIKTKINKTSDLFVNKQQNRRKRDVYFDKDGLMKQPSPKISYFAQIMMPDNWVKSTKK
jgi:hypothetical protein